jgi:predicted Zn-dependent protease
LDTPAVAQIVARMGRAFDANSTLSGYSPLYDKKRNRPRLNERIMDPRITLACDPNDPDGGYLPFNSQAFPLIPMTFVDAGVLKQLAYETSFAADQGVTPANDAPSALRMTTVPGTRTSTVDEMIASCKEGIYVNRLSQLQGVDSSDGGALTGLTNGGCFLIRDGKIDKSIRDFRFIESPWFFLNRLIAIGVPERAPFGYSPWAGEWPIAPTVVPPLMVSDFNFIGLADAV